MADENDDLIPQKASLFPLTADDIVDNALQSLDEQQAREVSKKAADEVVRIAVEKGRRSIEVIGLRKKCETSSTMLTCSIKK